MHIFKRGLDDDFVEALNDEYKKSSLWFDVVNDPDLFIGIRDNYLNVYYLGNSLLKIHFESGFLRSCTHYKYLLKGKIDNPYVRFDLNGKVDYQDGKFMESSPSIKTLKLASRPYAGVEKKGVHDIVKANDNVIDVEVALTQEAECRESIDSGVQENDAPSAPRIDFAALMETKNGGLELQFFEAKHFSYSSVLRTSSGAPKVIKQINRYEKLIDKFDGQIVSSYEKVCRNLAAILPEHRLCGRAKAISEGAAFKVSNQPRLVIFGFDADQRDGSSWKPHLEKLNDLLSGRVLSKGKSSKFVNGIS